MEREKRERGEGRERGREGGREREGKREGRGRKREGRSKTHPNFPEEVSHHIECRYTCGRSVVLNASEGSARGIVTLRDGIVVCVDERGGGVWSGGGEGTRGGNLEGRE